MVRSRRRLLAFVCLGAALLLAGGAATRWYHSRQPDHRLHLGQQALERGDRDTTRQLVAALERAGHKDHANLLRADILYRDGEYLHALDTLNRIREEGNLRLQAATVAGWCF